MLDLLNVNTIFFTLWGYPMSYLEFFGTLLNIVCVWLVARKNILTWPVGLIAVALFALLFYQIQLYSDFLEQIYYIGTGLWGWWAWTKLRKNNGIANDEVPVRYNTRRQRIITVSIIATGTLLLGYFMSNIHVYFPGAFPEAASYPYMDALTTVMSFVAQILLIYRFVENWMLWIIIDVIAIGLYTIKGIMFVAFLYVILLILATFGLLNWRKEHKLTNTAEASS